MSGPGEHPKASSQGEHPKAPPAVAGGTQTTAEKQLLLVATNKQQRRQLLLVAPDNSKKTCAESTCQGQGSTPRPPASAGSTQADSRERQLQLVPPGNSCDDIEQGKRHVIK